MPQQLLTPVRLGALELKNRVIMAPLTRSRAGNPGRVAEDLLGLGRPEIDWVKLSEAQGVPAVNASTAEAFDAALAKAFAEPGPHLIAAHVPAR